MLLAVHIADGVLTPPWWLGPLVSGFPLFVGWSAFRIRDDEISRVGVLTAALFVASQIHIPLGPASVHLLLNGLAGVILKRRAGFAIAVALVLQALLFGHGGLTTLGVNTLVLGLPAVAAGYLFPIVRKPLGRFAGAALGFFAAGTTVLLNAAVIALGAETETVGAAVILLANVPVILAESLLTGAIVVYLEKAELLPPGGG